jgi:hypothetical protein
VEFSLPSDFDDLKRKSRIISGGQRNYQVGTQGAAQGPTMTDFSASANNGSQVTLTEGHPWPPNNRSMEDIGGPFWTTKTYVTDRIGGKPLNWEDFPFRTAQTANWRISNGSSWPIGYSYEGHFLPVNPTNLAIYWSSVPNPSSSETLLKSLGTTAVARCKPTNPAANLSVSLAELWREGIPKAPGLSTWKDRTNLARGAGSEYLNTVFGWLPLVNDIEDVARAMSLQDKIWRQYQRDSGRVIRRQYSFPTEKTTTELSKVAGQRPWPTTNFQVDSTLGTLTKTRTTLRDRWFSGAFTYYLPKAEGDGPTAKWFNALQKAKTVYGLTLDPEVVWNLAPWSWAADWFSNTGDTIANITDTITDGLVMHYGYVMEHVVEYDEYSLMGYRPHKGSLDHDLGFVVVRETKQRLRASPYGFGLTWESFSPKQLAILAALGLSKTPK